jgi:hypothetical protein
MIATRHARKGSAETGPRGNGDDNIGAGLARDPWINWVDCR